MSRWRPSGLGLRARITLFFAFGGLLLSVTIAIATLTLARQSLLDQRDDLAFAVATGNGRRVQTLLTPDAEVQAIFASLSTTEGTYALISSGDDNWTAATPEVFNAENVPGSLVDLVDRSQAGRMRTDLDGRPALVTGIPLPGTGQAAYFEALLLDDVEETLEGLAIIVFSVGAVATLLAAALGSWASRRTLTPLVEFRAAAESLAAGELDTRLEAPADADLASLTASFNEMAGALENRIERDARFASEVSHELRSPLMTLSASIEVLDNQRDQLSERGQTALDLLRGDVDRFTQLVEDLLEISRYDVGTASLHAEPLRFAEFVRQAVAHGPHPDAIVTSSDAAERTVIQADKRRLAQTIANLVDNATKYGDGQITVELDRIDDIVMLAVEDEGPGVPHEERGQIFDRFSRGSAAGSRGPDSGSGLGLSLVAEHVGLHGGWVWVDDRTDRRPGARFLVAWPVGEAPSDDQHLAEELTP